MGSISDRLLKCHCCHEIQSVKISSPSMIRFEYSKHLLPPEGSKHSPLLPTEGSKHLLPPEVPKHSLLLPPEGPKHSPLLPPEGPKHSPLLPTEGPLCLPLFMIFKVPSTFRPLPTLPTTRSLPTIQG